MSFKNYDDIEPKTEDFSALYKKINRLLMKTLKQMENAYGRALNKKEVHNLISIHFKVRRMVRCYKYLEEELKSKTSLSDKETC